MAERQGFQLPNWARGIQEWAQTHKPQAALVVVGILVFLYIFVLSGGEEEQPQQVVQQQEEEDIFGSGEGFTGELTTASSLVQLQQTVENLRIELEDQARQHSLLRRSVGGLTSEVRQAKESVSAEVQEIVTGRMEQRMVELVDAELGGTLDRVLEVVREEKSEIPEVEVAEAVLPMQLLRPDKTGFPTDPPADAAAAPAAAPPPGGPLPGDPQEQNWLRLPVGSVASGRVVTGLFATTVTGDAVPTLIQFDTEFVGPNGSRVPLKGCLVVGAAAADLTSVRARIQVRRMACVFPNGQVFEATVNGMVTGADGIMGVPGKVHQRKGQWLANMLTSMGIATAALYGDYSIAKSLGAGAGTFFGDLPSVSDNLAQPLQAFFLERAEEIVPVIWIDAGTKVHVVMLEGLTLQGLSPRLAQAAAFGDGFQ